MEDDNEPVDNNERTNNSSSGKEPVDSNERTNNSSSGKDVSNSSGNDTLNKGHSKQDASGGGTSSEDALGGSNLSGSPAIARSQTPIKDIILPIFALLGALVTCAALSKYFIVDCKNYLIVWLAYPLLFGAAGVVFGGAIRLQGKLILFGYPWTADLLGGAAAALMGFGIVSFMRPPSCGLDLNHELSITNLPLEQPDPSQAKSLNYFVTVEPEANLDVQVLANAGNKRTLNVAFKGNYLSRLIFRSYQLDTKQPDGKNYKYLATCEIEFRDLDASQNITIHRSQPNKQVTLAFNPEYFVLVNEDADKNRNLCLKGQFDADNTNNFISVAAITPLKIVQNNPNKGVVGGGNNDAEFSIIFATEKPKTVDDPKLAAKIAAMQDAATTSEVLTSSGTGAALPPKATRADVAPSDVATKEDATSTPRSAGCLASDTLRGLVDRFLASDDLEQATRRQIYKQWPSINCYVLPLATNRSDKVSAQTRSRALKLLNNAIANSGTGYWQPNGANKRNFALALPYVQDSDLEKIFGQIDIDDDLVRGQVVQFIKTFPVNVFEKLFQAKLAMLRGAPANVSKTEAQRFAIAASGLYYNRITDWLNGTAGFDPALVQKLIAADFDQSQSWTQEALLGNGAKAYAAMEYYARGIVQREIQLNDRGQADFAAMLSLLKQTSQAYPSRSIHIAQALAVVSGGPEAAVLDIFRQIQSAEDLGTASPFGESTAFIDKVLALYPGPRSDYAKLGPSVATKEGGNLLLQNGNWYFVRTANKIGWISSKN